MCGGEAAIGVKARAHKLLVLLLRQDVSTVSVLWPGR